MATYSSRRLEGEKRILTFFLSKWGYLDYFFTEMFSEWSATFHKTFVQIAEFD